ncbi:MAG: hypothetical protein ACRCSU_08555 [Paracoccaceae bacterium]
MKMLTPVDYWRAGFRAWCTMAEMQGSYARTMMGAMSTWIVAPAERDLFERQSVAQPGPDAQSAVANTAEPPRKLRRHATPV